MDQSMSESGYATPRSSIGRLNDSMRMGSLNNSGENAAYGVRVMTANASGLHLHSMSGDYAMSPSSRIDG